MNVAVDIWVEAASGVGDSGVGVGAGAETDDADDTHWTAIGNKGDLCKGR